MLAIFAAISRVDPMLAIFVAISRVDPEDRADVYSFSFARSKRSFSAISARISSACIFSIGFGNFLCTGGGHLDFFTMINTRILFVVDSWQCVLACTPRILLPCIVEDRDIPWQRRAISS